VQHLLGNARVAAREEAGGASGGGALERWREARSWFDRSLDLL
jgi:hypothetical protein